jgi:hypothetical protein
LRYLHEEENQEILDHNRPGVIDSSDLRIALPYNMNFGRLATKKHLFVEDANVPPIFMSDQHPTHGQYIQERKADKEEKNNTKMLEHS